MLKLHELAPSPNNTKVRMAMRFKGIPFEAVPVDPMDRSGVIAVSGQELTPVIEDRGIVLNDSEAILHYLDANYRDAPRLWPADRAGRKAADAFKNRIDASVRDSFIPVFWHALGFREAPEDEARERFVQLLAAWEDELAEEGGFGSPLNDLRVAEFATYALPTPAVVERVPAFRRFRDVCGVTEADQPKLSRFLAPWNERLA